MKLLRICLLFVAAIGASLGAEESAASTQAQSAAKTRYRLFARDLLHLAVHGEPDMSVDRRVDGLGEINVPLLGQVKVLGLTIAEVQALLAKRFVDEEIFVRPGVVVSVIEYSPKEIMVLGQVGKQGKQVLPPEAAAVSIVEAITSAGGFTRIAKGDAVRVTRTDAREGDQTFTLNVERMIDGRASAAEMFQLQPGDVVFVPERVF